MQIQQFQKRFKKIPKIIELDHLTVTGDVYFGRNVTLRGTVIVVANEGQRIDIPDGCILENRLLSGNLTMTVREHACCHTSAMRPNSWTFLFSFSGSVIGCQILRKETLFFITILDMIYPRTRPRFAFFWDGTYTLTHSYLRIIETPISFLTSIAMDGVSLCFPFWLGSLVLGSVEGFNGMEWKMGSSYPTSDVCRALQRLRPSYLIIRSLPPALHLLSGHRIFS